MRRACLEVCAGATLMLAVGAGVAWWFTLPAIYLFRAVALYGLVSTLVLRHLPLPMPGTGLGPANRVTLGRATLVLALAALVPEPQVSINGGDWFIIGLAAVALCLDGVDGWLARRTGNTTKFGARFDMELDSLLMLVLAALVWRSGKVPFWVIGLGLPRYVFFAAGWCWTWLRNPLPERLRRKAGCVVQGVTLLICLGPIVPERLSAAAAGVTLALLLTSFAADVVWLFRRADSSLG